MKKLITFISIVIPLSLIRITIPATMLVSCAKLGTPPGGAKDTIPPYVVKSKPLNYSTNYNRNKIVLKFNEFVVLKNQFSEFTISPPLEKKPLPVVRGRGIVVDLPASKLDTATYTLDFGQSIQDNNEGNKLPNYQFVVSKNAYIDSFALSGKVLDAFTHQPDEERISVFLHKNLNDTAPYKVIPNYLGRTNPKGEFTINHIAPGTYSVFALKDNNNNYLYDLPNEVIAFSKNLLYLYPDSFKRKKELADSMLAAKKAMVLNDTLPENEKGNKLDSMLSDTSGAFVYGYSVNLFSFTEKPPYKQFLDDYSRDVPENFKLIFNEPLDKKIKLNLLNPDTTGLWYYLENDPKPDTLVYWLADSNLVNNDSIVVQVEYPFTDTLGVTALKYDTLLFRNPAVKKTKKSSSRGRGGIFGLRQKQENVDTVKEVPRLSFETNISRNGFDLNLPVIITTNAPVTGFNKDKYRLAKIEDTIETPVNSKFEPDTSNFRKFRIYTDLEPFTTYKLDFYEGLLTDIYKRTIDSSSVTFTTQRDDYYGTININFENIKSPLIVQLLGKDEVVARQKEIYNDSKVTFGYIKPGSYSLKIIADDNNNGKWDTGDFKQKLQPESVDYYPKKLDVRSNWEVEYNWEVKW